MKDRNEPLAKRIAAPSFLTKYQDDESFELVDQFRVLPSLHIIHSLTSPDLKSLAAEGGVLVLPGRLILTHQPGETFLVVPLHFYPEWLKRKDRNDKDDTVPRVLEQSFDPMSPTAKKARDPKMRYECYPGEEGKQKPKQYRYVECLRFPVMIYGDHPLSGEVAVMSFERGEHQNGIGFTNAVSMRKTEVDGQKVRVPLWSQVWQASVSLRDRGGNKWLGFDLQVPDDHAPYINEDDHERLHALHVELKDAYKKKTLRVEEAAELTDEAVDTDARM